MLVYSTKYNSPGKLLFAVLHLLIPEALTISLDLDRHGVNRKVEKPKLCDAVVTFANVAS